MGSLGYTLARTNTHRPTMNDRLFKSWLSFEYLKDQASNKASVRVLRLFFGEGILGAVY